MKRIFTFLFSVFSIAFLWGQIEWTGSIDVSDFVVDAVVSKQKQIVLMHRNPDFTPAGITALDSFGQVVFQNQFPYIHFGDATNADNLILIPTPDSGIVMYVEYIFCQMVNIQKLEKYDKNWNLVFSESLDDYEYTDGDVLSNGDVIFIKRDENAVQKINGTDGSVIWTKSIGDNDLWILDILVNAGDTIIVSTGSGLYLMEGSSGEVLDTLPIFLYRMEKDINGNIFGITLEYNILKLNDALLPSSLYKILCKLTFIGCRRWHGITLPSKQSHDEKRNRSTQSSKRFFQAI